MRQALIWQNRCGLIASLGSVTFRHGQEYKAQSLVMSTTKTYLITVVGPARSATLQVACSLSNKAFVMITVLHAKVVNSATNT